MKRTICFVMTLFVVLLALSACGSNTEETTTEASASTSTQKETTSGRNILVVYFSGTGTTEKVANTMAEALSADLYEIVALDPYTEDDLNYNDDNSRTTVEQNDDSIRPEISGSIDNWDQYDIVILGHPIWWGEEPRIMDTFVESYDFTGKTVTTFCTSGGSSLGNSCKQLEENATGGTWLAGQRFESDVTVAELQTWAVGLGLVSE